MSRRVIAALPDIAPEFIADPSTAAASCEYAAVAPGEPDKRTLIITRNRGSFLRKCPGSKSTMCCGYHVLDWAANCPMDCEYCVLQTLLNNPVLILHANIDDLLAEVDRAVDSQPDRMFRIGTGEWTDSMALDHLTGFSKLLVPHLAAKPNAVLEIKTKTANVANLPGLDHRGRVVVSWSVNPPEIVGRFEHGTATLDERLTAARICAEAGYRIGFHFDPIIRHDGWRQGYADVVERVFEAIPPERVAWVSLGTLRFPKKLGPVVERRFPGSVLLLDEFVAGVDGKMHYFRPLRAELLRAVASAVRGRAPQVPLYLCMETQEVWREVFRGQTAAPAASVDDLVAMLDRAAAI